MRRAYKSGAASSPPANDLTSVGYPTEGNAVDDTPSTIPGPYWFHMVTEAIVRVIEDRRIAPSDSPAQFLVALKSLIDSRAASIDYATNSEAEQGTATDKVINPATLRHVVDRIETGDTSISIDYADNREAVAGTATDKVINPATLKHVVDRLISGAPGALDTLNELAAAIADDADYAATITTALALKAPLASPALTGEPTAPTPAGSDDSTRIATTEFVQNVAGRDAILASDIALAAGQDVTVDLSGRMADFRWLELLVGDNRNDYDLTPLKIERSLITDRVVTGGLYTLRQSTEHGGARLYELNAETGESTPVGASHDFSTGTGTGLGMAYHNGKMYALVQTDNTARTALYEVNTETGTFTRIADGPTARTTGGAIGLSLASHGGFLYALIDYNNSPGPVSFYEVNEETGTFTAAQAVNATITDLDLNFGLGMASHLGVLYALGEINSRGELVLFAEDQAPPFSPNIAIFGNYGTISTRDDFTFFGASLTSHAGVLYAYLQIDIEGRTALYEVDPINLTLTRVGNPHTNYRSSGHAPVGVGLASNVSIGGGFTQGDWLLERVTSSRLGVRTSAAKHIHQVIGIR